MQNRQGLQWRQQNSASSLCSRDALFAGTFCGTRHLSWLYTDKNGVWFIKQNNPCLFCGVGKV